MEPEGAIGDSQTSSRGHHAELLEACRTLTGSHGENGLPHLHRPTSCGGDQFHPVDNDIQNPVTYALRGQGVP